MNLIPWKSKREDFGLEPFGGTTTLTTLRNEMDRMFNRFMGALDAPATTFATLGGWWPTVDVAETDDEVTVRAEVPGVAPKDLDVALSGQALTLSGEKKEEHERKSENFYHCERRFGSFHRRIELPAPVDPDKIKAEHKNGVLLVTLKKHTAATPKRIKVEAVK